ncbi:hypothetical protein KAU33_04455 [Candidatus Dependentiae bacterium]|nr:hypothetical protein [Candidatus Dependentiae bacterium]
MNKTCTKCDISKPLDEFYKSKDGKYGKRAICKKCFGKQSKKHAQEHPEKYRKYSLKYYYNNREDSLIKMKKYQEEHKDERREKGGYLSMYENKTCAAYLGVVIGERLCRHLFKDVEVMPFGNTGYDIICNKGKKIDVKTSCTRYNNGKYPHWGFDINENKIADFFILVAFDNRTDLNPLHLWMISGHEVNKNASKSISPSTVHKWSQWEKDIKNARLCCAEMKKINKEVI